MEIKYDVKLIINLKHTLNTIDEEIIKKDIMYFERYKIYKGQKIDEDLTVTHYLTLSSSTLTYVFNEPNCIVYSTIPVTLEESIYNDPALIKEKLKDFLEFNINLVFEDSDPTSIYKTEIKYIDVINIEEIKIEK